MGYMAKYCVRWEPYLAYYACFFMSEFKSSYDEWFFLLSSSITQKANSFLLAKIHARDIDEN